MPKVVVENRNPRLRAKQRQELGTLRQLTVQPATRARYDKALQAFLQFLKDNRLDLPRQRDRIDALAAEYMEHLWTSGAGRGLASDTLAALQDQDPRLKGQLQTSWRLLKTWHTHETPSRAPPFPEYILHCLVGWALMQQNFSFAVSLLVGFLLNSQDRRTTDNRKTPYLLFRTERGGRYHPGLHQRRETNGYC